MSSENPSPVDAIIAEYLRAIDAGNAPDRSALLVTHPEFADELRAFFADLDGVEQAAAPLREIVQQPSPADIATLPPPPSNPAEMSTLAPQSASAAGPLGVVRYFGDYELLEEIARGGMGVVYKARQVSLNRIVAVKMILAGQLASAADVQRFKTEAEAAANLDHPNILPIYEVGEHEGQHYFSMKLIAGGSLSDAIRSQSLDQRQGVELLEKVCRAVHFAHQRGILHRDLKPANILLDREGVPYVTDFGLAKKVEGDSALTQTGAVVGTPSYMAPEQVKAQKQLSPLADVYALGAILYELLAGQPPFRGTTQLDTLLLVLEQDPVDPRQINQKADQDLSVIALKCLAKDPALRFDSAQAVADDLARWLNGAPIKARGYSRVERLRRWIRLHPLEATLRVTSLLPLSAILAITIIGSKWLGHYSLAVLLLAGAVAGGAIAARGKVLSIVLVGTLCAFALFMTAVYLRLLNVWTNYPRALIEFMSFVPFCAAIVVGVAQRNRVAALFSAPVLLFLAYWACRGYDGAWVIWFFPFWAVAIVIKATGSRFAALCIGVALLSFTLWASLKGNGLIRESGEWARAEDDDIRFVHGGGWCDMEGLKMVSLWHCMEDWLSNRRELRFRSDVRLRRAAESFKQARNERYYGKRWLDSHGSGDTDLVEDSPLLFDLGNRKDQEEFPALFLFGPIFGLLGFALGGMIKFVHWVAGGSLLDISCGAVLGVAIGISVPVYSPARAMELNLAITAAFYIYPGVVICPIAGAVFAALATRERRPRSVPG